MKKNMGFLIPTLLCLLASVASVFLPVLTYRYADGRTAAFNIFDFIDTTNLSEALNEYTGSFRVTISPVTIAVLAFVAVGAIIAAFVGVITVSMQRPNTWQFVLAFIGIVGTAIPALLLLLAVVLSWNYYPGNFSCGVYPIITPITMVLCVYSVTRRQKKTKAELAAEKRAEGLITPGGDL